MQIQLILILLRNNPQSMTFHPWMCVVMHISIHTFASSLSLSSLTILSRKII